MHKIFIDPGHGGRDPGAIGNGMREADINLEVSKTLRDILKAAELDVMLSREGDVSVGINERWQAANKWQASYFISIHVNAGRGTGAETLYAHNNALALARALQDGYSKQMGLANRRVWHRGDVGVLRHSACPAVLLELAFIDSPLHNPDVGILRDKRGEMAQAVADAILAYLNIPVVSTLKEEVRFATLEEVPIWGRATIGNMVEEGLLKGSGGGLDLSIDMVRTFVILDRAGVL
ncbi:MAG: N-acetylmuramoyl-L-alanine amidase [Defluviitaleaceae bacterium]|nr:N-acetylmuramoyl-L-alanine amidase [Defluviitaleaceae bacterium]